MVFYKCDGCRDIFSFDSEDDVPTRPAEVEDGTYPWEEITACPCCGEPIEEVEACPCCGSAPVQENDTGVCVECEAQIKADFRDLMIRKYNRRYEMSDCAMEDILLTVLSN